VAILLGIRAKGNLARGKRQQARGNRQEAKGKRQEARGKRQKARGNRQKAGKAGGAGEAGEKLITDNCLHWSLVTGHCKLKKPPRFRGRIKRSTDVGFRD
jgi:hypothetical protein